MQNKGSTSFTGGCAHPIIATAAIAPDATYTLLIGAATG
jgi:hypothetical protein